MKKILLIAILFTMSVVIMACSSDEADSVEENVESDGETEEQSDGDENTLYDESNLLSLGQSGSIEATNSSYEVTVESFEVLNDIVGQQSSEEVYILLDYQITNTGEEAIQGLAVTEGNLFNAAGAKGLSVTSYDFISIPDTEIKPGESAAAQILFEQEESDEYYDFIYNFGSSDGELVWRLNADEAANEFDGQLTQEDIETLKGGEMSEFAQNIEVLEVEKVTHNGEEIEFPTDQEIMIESEGEVYIDSDFITTVADYELTYDEENQYVEVIEGKADFQFEPQFDENDGGIIEVNEFYFDENDEYISRSDYKAESQELYNLIEYKNHVYLSYAITNDFLKETVNYNQSESTVEIGENSKSKQVSEILHDSGGPKAKENVTIQGEKYDGAIDFDDVGSFTEYVWLNGEHKYSHFNGSIYYKTDSNLTLTVSFVKNDNNQTVIKEFELEPGEMKDVDIDFSGEHFMGVFSKQAIGNNTGGQLLVIGEVK
ncbi:hypothetical protein SAMN04487943_105175 [Gracilibacillus orientalis]|uniref:DUF4352 domain-containing protein n=1 Tax=Gracilibacillus orientalis TaxID=334253 RepID=A0A1I4LS52_9BACI|nr:hypothetical protein [Gracilibacillus orientalis]SFL93840.1 hypothetical protein SAMN04487943_105175 [Gracilibacillus orientalis]